MRTKKDTRAGYHLERVYVGSQEYRLVDPDGIESTPELDDRGVHFGWDWRPVGSKRFEVIVDLSIDPIKKAPESARVRLIGLFELADESPSIGFRDFVKNNACAILLPFAREVISTMTGRGPYGAFHVYPLNLLVLLKDAPIEDTTGWKYLEENPAAADSFGIDRTSEASPAPG